jgi:uncharacterized protein (DUF2267 family)
MIPSTPSFVEHVASHAGVPIDHADRIVRTVIAGIGTYLSSSQRQLVADELPPALATALREGSDFAAPIDERVLAPGVTVGQAREFIASTCRVLVEELSDEALHAIRENVPPAIAAYLEPTSPELAHVAVAPHRYETLASGRPGSLHPIDESPPSHHANTVDDANPHASTKLSSARR